MKKIFSFILFCCLMATTALAGQFDQYRGLPDFVVSEDGTWCLYYEPMFNYLQAAAGQLVGGDNSPYYIQVFTEEPMTVNASYTTDGNPDNGFKAYGGEKTTTWSNMHVCYSAEIYYEFDARGANGPIEDFIFMTITVVRANGEELSMRIGTTIAAFPYCTVTPEICDFGYILPDSMPFIEKTVTMEYCGYPYLRFDFGMFYDGGIALNINDVTGSLYSSETISFNVVPTAYVEPETRWGYGHHYDTIKVIADFDETIANIPVHYCVVDTIPEIIDDTIPETPEDTIAVPALISTEHVFSIAPGKKVMFTRGNLYWDGSAWALERKQTDRATRWDANHVSHLYWANTGDEAHAIYAPDGNSFSLSDHLFCDGSDANHYLSIDGQDSLYCLSRAEWNYLLYEYGARPYNSRLVKYPVSVDGVDSCIVVAPDDYTGTISDVYTSADMNQIADAGMLVLPPTGHRSSTGIYALTTPRYWTRDLTDVESFAADFYAFWTDDLGGLISTICHTGRSYASGIRLAKEVKESTIEVRVKVPDCGPITFTPAITGVPGENYLLMSKDNDGWYYYILPTPQSGVELNMEIRDFARRNNYLLRTDTVPGTRFGFSCITGGEQLLEFDLTEGYEWEMCESLLSDTNIVWDVHIWLSTYEVGDTLPATARVTIEKTNTTYTDTIAINWRLVGGQIDPQNPVFLWDGWYGPSFEYSYIRDNYGSTNYTAFHWHYGPYQETIVHQSSSGPLIEMNGMTTIKGSMDMTVYTGETVRMERIFHQNSAVSFRGNTNVYWRFIVNDVRYDIHAGDTTLGVNVITNDTMTICTFPASLFGPGQYKIDAYLIYDAYLAENPSNWKHRIDATTVNLTILPGAEIAETTQGTAVYDEETVTVTLTDAVIENTEIGITIGAEGAVIEVSGSSTITAEQIGIDCATSVEITATDDENPEEALLITAARPIYTAADSITLTISGVNLELDCPLTSPAPAREAFLAPRRAIEARHAARVADYSVISGFEHLVLENSHIVEPAGAYYSEALREMVEADGTTLVKHVLIESTGITTSIQGTHADIEQISKLLRDGHLYIRKGNHLYNVLGTKIE